MLLDGRALELLPRLSLEDALELTLLVARKIHVATFGSLPTETAALCSALHRQPCNSRHFVGRSVAFESRGVGAA